MRFAFFVIGFKITDITFHNRVLFPSEDEKKKVHPYVKSDKNIRILIKFWSVYTNIFY